MITETEILLLRCLDVMRENPGDAKLIAEIEARFRVRNEPLTFADFEARYRNWRGRLKDENKPCGD